MNNSKSKLLTVAAAVLVLGAAPPAMAATQADVSKARASCAQHKARVANLERKGQSDELSQARKDWESACQQAEVLINEIKGTAPPKVVAPAPA